MNRTKAFALIAVLSTLLLTASIASAHGRSTHARPVKLAKVVHAKAVPMARAARLKAADPVPPITYPTETPSVDPCSDDDAYEGTSDSSDSSESSDSSDDDSMTPPITPPTTGGTCSYTDDDSSMGMDD